MNARISSRQIATALRHTRLIGAGTRLLSLGVLALMTWPLTGCTTTTPWPPVIDNFGALEDAVTAAGYPCDGTTGRDLTSGHGEVDTSCGATFPAGSITYCANTDICQHVIVELRRHPEQTPEGYVLDGGHWLVRGPYPDLQEIRTQLGGSMIFLGTERLPEPRA